VTSIHFGGLLGDRLVVSASFFPSSPPMNPTLVTYQLRYMATDFDVQGRGYGARVLASPRTNFAHWAPSRCGPTVVTPHSVSIGTWDG